MGALKHLPLAFYQFSSRFPSVGHDFGSIIQSGKWVGLKDWIAFLGMRLCWLL